MRRLTLRLAPLLALLLVVSGCSDSTTSTSGTSTTPAAAATTETFTGTLTSNAAFTYPFVVLASGTVSAVLTTLSPDSNVPIGIGLGTWNGSVCQVILANDTSIQGSSVPATASASGNFCVRVYDSGGRVVAPESYVVQVTHP
jgi:hypothetical protein